MPFCLLFLPCSYNKLFGGRVNCAILHTLLPSPPILRSFTCSLLYLTGSAQYALGAGILSVRFKCLFLDGIYPCSLWDQPTILENTRYSKYFAGIVGVRFKRLIMDDTGLTPKFRGPRPPVEDSYK